MKKFAFALSLSVVLFGCEDNKPPMSVDAATDSMISTDVKASDSLSPDAGSPDATAPDAGTASDAGVNG